MAVQENEQAVRRSFDAWNGDESAHDVIDENCVYADPAIGEARGRAAIVEIIRGYRQQFPDLEFELHEMVSDGEFVAVRWSSDGTHAESGRRVRVGGLALNRVSDGKLVQGWSQWDNQGMVQQLRAE
jgi:predicted ester cyclase